MGSTRKELQERKGSEENEEINAKEKLGLRKKTGRHFSDQCQH